MQKMFKPVRLVIFFGILVAFLTLFVASLYVFQLFDVDWIFYDDCPGDDFAAKTAFFQAC